MEGGVGVYRVTGTEAGFGRHLKDWKGVERTWLRGLLWAVLKRQPTPTGHGNLTEGWTKVG